MSRVNFFSICFGFLNDIVGNIYWNAFYDKDLDEKLKGKYTSLWLLFGT